MKHDALVQTFVREAFLRDWGINENLNIMLGVSLLKKCVRECGFVNLLIYDYNQ